MVNPKLTIGFGDNALRKVKSSKTEAIKIFFTVLDSCTDLKPVSYTHLDVYKRQGMESSHPPTTPVMALVPPGPVVTHTAAMRP